MVNDLNTNTSAASFIIFYTDGDGNINMKLSYNNENSILSVLYTVFGIYSKDELFQKIIDSMHHESEEDLSFKLKVANMFSNISSQMTLLDTLNESAMLPTAFV
jgi:Ca2+-binding EF-hand superfamily protein